MLSILAVVGLLVPSLPAPAPANTLTPKEVQAGWILLFDGETDFGWRQRGDAKWKIADGAIESDTGTGGGICTSTEFADFELQADVWIDGKMNSGIYLRIPAEGEEITSEMGYEVQIFDSGAEYKTGSLFGIAKPKAEVKTAGKWSTVHVKCEGDHLTVSIDGKTTADVHNSKFARGVVGFQRNGEGSVKYRNVRLKPLGAKSLFNGKDLTGWTVQPGADHPSVFTVTPEGWMNVKNGNGNIESSAQFGDFCLQLDIISNGKNLNSGVFYRNQPGGFWLGYEAQIRNQWQGEDRTKPVDYGTGGIYNRQPARKVVSSDHEWFTMTVIAHGLHMCCWVNGIQVSDFTDMRPPNEDNARAGSRTKAGTFTIQGHDPTTDLSFRNIRAVEYPGKR